jgi:predicted exporter
VLREHRYLLSDAVTAERFTVDSLRAALVERVRGLSGGGALFEKRLVSEDPTGETMHLVQGLAGTTRPPQRFGIWFSTDGARALLIADTKAPGSDLRGQDDSVAALEKAFEAAKGDTHALMRYSSPGAMAARSRALIANDAARLGLISTTLILAILGYVYRSPLIVFLCVVPALTGLMLGMVAVNAAFGGVHAITIGFGATLLGEAVDYPGYLLTQKRQGETAEVTRKRLARTLSLAVLTTAAASAALLIAGFPGLAQLGLLTIVGVTGAGLVTALALPCWVPAAWHPAWAKPTRPLRFELSPAKRWTLALAFAATLVTVAAPKIWWDDDLGNMNPLPEELKQTDRELRAALHAPDVRYALMVDGATREDALKMAERARPVLERAVTARSLDGFELASDFLPSEETQRLRQAALPDSAQLRARFAKAAEGLPITVSAFAAFFAEVEAARNAPLLTANDLVGTAIGLKVESLLRSDGARWYIVIPLYGVQDAPAVRDAVSGSAHPDSRWVDLRAASQEMMASFRARAAGAFAIGAVLIIAVLVIGLRSLHRGIRVAIPVGVAVLSTAAAMIALGYPLTVFHLVALMLVAGIGTNYALFLAQSTESTDAQMSVFRSLAVVGGTTLCAFATLATSPAPVLRAIGLTVTLGVVTSLAFSVLLPVARSDARAVR